MTSTKNRPQRVGIEKRDPGLITLGDELQMYKYFPPIAEKKTPKLKVFLSPAMLMLKIDGEQTLWHYGLHCGSHFQLNSTVFNSPRLDNFSAWRTKRGILLSHHLPPATRLFSQTPDETLKRTGNGTPTQTSWMEIQGEATSPNLISQIGLVGSLIYVCVCVIRLGYIICLMG